MNHRLHFSVVVRTGEIWFCHQKQMEWKEFQVRRLAVSSLCSDCPLALIDFLVPSYWGWPFKRSDKHNSTEGDWTSGGAAAAPVPNWNKTLIPARRKRVQTVFKHLKRTTQEPRSYLHHGRCNLHENYTDSQGCSSFMKCVHEKDRCCRACVCVCRCRFHGGWMDGTGPPQYL